MKAAKLAFMTILMSITTLFVTAMEKEDVNIKHQKTTEIDNFAKQILSIDDATLFYSLDGSLLDGKTLILHFLMRSNIVSVEKMKEKFFVDEIEDLEQAVVSNDVLNNFGVQTIADDKITLLPIIICTVPLAIARVYSSDLTIHDRFYRLFSGYDRRLVSRDSFH